jgi:hypothetical protein
MQSWLRGHARLSPSAAGQLVRTGRALEHLPAVASAFSDGQMTAEQVAVIAPITRPEHRAAAIDQGVDLAAVDATLAHLAATRPHPELGQVVHHYLARLDPDGTEPDPTEGRSLSLAKHSDGSVSGRFELDAVGGEKVRAVLESMVQADRPAGDLRTRGQQLGDALVQWADNTLAAGELPILRTVKPHVIALIPLADLADPHTGHGAATTGFGARISAARARMLACDGGSPGSSSDPNRSRWRWAAPTGSFHPVCGGPSRSVTGTACSPAATSPATGVTSITSCTGSTAERPRWRTRRCSANATRTLCPPRLPGGTATRRPMAHLAARRHRDRSAPPTCCGLSAPAPARGLLTGPRRPPRTGR